jgi:thiol-disulfide isomerase/thioredoxin
MKRFTRLLGLCAAVMSIAAMAAPAQHVRTLKVTTLKGAHFDLSSQRGKWVIVNYWATWCNPCIKEMPDISRFVATHKQVVAIGLAFEDTDRADIQAFLKKHPVVYPVAQVDISHPPADFAQPLGLPTTYLIAPDGTLAKKFIGPIHAADLEQVIGSHTPG